jgi:hypothetical protein
MAESDEDEELRKLFEDETVESKLPVRDRWLRRIERIVGRRPGLLKEAARKALAGEKLAEDEFVLTHKGCLPDEWTEEMESEWSLILRREWEDWTE